jgi:nucleotide-binding universal stress UspA family protein
VKTNILLAVDVAAGGTTRHVDAATEMTTEMIRDCADHVIVLHVREFSILRLPQTMTDGGGATGRKVVEQVVSRLRSSGVHASGLVREADIGHVAQTILHAAREFDVRLVVLGSSGRTAIRRLPVNSVAAHVLHAATVPVLIVPAAVAPSTAGSPIRRAEPVRRLAQAAGLQR